MAISEFAVACDVGATKIAYGVVGPEGLVTYCEQPTPTDELARLDTEPEKTDAFLETVGGQIIEFATEYNAPKAAIGFNGPTWFCDGKSTVGALYKITEEAFDLGSRLGKVMPALGKLGMSVLALGDVEAAAYGSAQYVKTEVKPEDVVMYLNLGTGFNAEIIRRGMSMRSQGYPAEWGNSIVEMPDGQYVTWGTLMSGGGVEACEKRSTREIYEDHSVMAGEIWLQVAKHVAGFIAMQRPGVGGNHVVIGGGISACKDRFSAALEENLKARLSVLSADCGSPCDPPNIYYVPKEALHTIALEGAYIALQQRRGEAVQVGGLL